MTNYIESQTFPNWWSTFKINWILDAMEFGGLSMLEAENWFNEREYREE